MCRAVLEGVAYNYRALAESLDVEMINQRRQSSSSSSSAAAAALPPLPLVGGGARSRLWTQTLADVLGRPIKPVADSSTVAARGCAAGAFQHLGLWGGSSGDLSPPPAGYFPTDGNRVHMVHIVSHEGEGGETYEKNINNNEHMTNIHNMKEEGTAAVADGGEEEEQLLDIVYPDESTRARHDANYAVFVKLHAALAAADVGNLAS